MINCFYYESNESSREFYACYFFFNLQCCIIDNATYLIDLIVSSRVKYLKSHVASSFAESLNASPVSILVFRVERSSASVTTVSVNSNVVVTVDFTIAIAVLCESVHVALNRSGSAERIVGASCECSIGVVWLVIKSRFATVRPVAPSYAERTANFAGTSSCGVTTRSSLANATEACLGYILLD